MGSKPVKDIRRANAYVKGIFLLDRGWTRFSTPIGGLWFYGIDRFSSPACGIERAVDIELSAQSLRAKRKGGRRAR
jgi:hypothetical protein